MNQFIKGLLSILIFIGISWFVSNQFIADRQHVQKSHNVFIEHDVPKRYDQPDKAASWLAARLSTPKGTNPASLNLKIKQALKQQAKEMKVAPAIPAFSFEDIGPGVFGGRIRAFAIHPEQEGVLLAGGVSGGIWKSTNDGQSWQHMDDFLPNIAIGSMTTDPDDPNRVFVGTGEGFFNFDAAQGAGIYVSDDFGDTWSVLQDTLNSNFYFVNRLARIADSDILLAATRRGIFRSEDLGHSWTEVSNHTTESRGFVDMKLNPTDKDHVLAVHYGSSNDALVLEINSPQSLVGTYDAIAAAFGPSFTEAGINGEILLVDDNSGVAVDGCQSITNNISGQIALIQRGSCNFTDKVKNAQNAGAIAVLVYQNSLDAPITMGGEDDSITIPSAMVSKAVGDNIQMAGSTVLGIIKLAVSGPLRRFVMESTDAGVTWHVLDDNGLPKLNVGRMELNFGDDGVIYVAVANADDSTLGLWRSPGIGQSFTKTDSQTAFIERQGWYDLTLAVNPSDSNEVVMGAVDQYITFDGGATINPNTYWAPNLGQVPFYVHADHHGYYYSPHNSEHLYVVSDGGVSKSENGGLTYSHLNNGLNISQSYGIAVSPDGQRVTSGTQDNGSQMYYGDDNNWFEWQGGDGGYSAWDQQQGNFVYGSYVEGQMYGSSDRGNTVVAMELPDTEGALFIQPFVLDEHNGNRMMVGTDNVFLTNNARALSAAIWVDVSDTLDGSSVSALAFNPNNDSQAFVGTSNGGIYRIDDLGPNSIVTEITPTVIGNQGYIRELITDLKVSEQNRLYATLAGYARHRLISTGANDSNWQSESDNLPDMPLHQIAFDPINSNQMYLGSELGLWASSDNGWVRYEYGVAFTRVLDLVWHDQDTLFIGTHGRGTFQAKRSPFSVSYNKFITTQSSCGDDNILDPGESGTVIVDIENKSGWSLTNILVSWNTPVGITLGASSYTIDSLPPFGRVSIPVPVSLSNNSSCLSDIDLDMTLSYDGGISSHGITLNSGYDQGIHNIGFADGAEGVSKMVAAVPLGNDNWQQVEDFAFEGNQSWFASDESNYADKTLTSPWQVLTSGGNVLSFALRYDMEGDSNQYWDGGVLELRTDDSSWIDIGVLSTVPYDGLLYTNNSIQNRPAWSGVQTSWRQAVVDLGEDYAGKKVQFRFRVVADESSATVGFWVDDIKLTNSYAPATLTCDTCISENSGHTRPNKGMWYDPSRSGHGFVIESIDYQDVYYTMFYTYDTDGTNEWYNSVTTLSNGILNEAYESGTLDRPTWDWENNTFSYENNLNDGRLMINFNADQAAAHPACLDGHPHRLLTDSALVTWRIENEEATWCIQPIVAETSKPTTDFGGTWWGGFSEIGWGFSIAQSFDSVTSIIYYYDADGWPRWAIGSADNHEAGKPLTIPLLEVSGFGRSEPTIEPVTTQAGEFTVVFFNTTRDEKIDGMGNLELNFLGNAGGSWNRSDFPIAIYSAPHR